MSDGAEWRPIAPAGNIWRAGDALVWKRVKVEGGPWSASPSDLSIRHGFESAQSAAQHALAPAETVRS